ncbi:MAG TPA: methyltransferase, partial [Nitrospirota bacterium]
MDLREHKHYIMRHPWEVARVKALKVLLKSMLDKGPAVLDFGCGDGYVSSELFTDTAVNTITALDINLSNDQ